MSTLDRGRKWAPATRLPVFVDAPGGSPRPAAPPAVQISRVSSGAWRDFNSVRQKLQSKLDASALSARAPMGLASPATRAEADRARRALAERVELELRQSRKQLEEAKQDRQQAQVLCLQATTSRTEMEEKMEELRGKIKPGPVATSEGRQAAPRCPAVAEPAGAEPPIMFPFDAVVSGCWAVDLDSSLAPVSDEAEVVFGAAWALSRPAEDGSTEWVAAAAAFGVAAKAGHPEAQFYYARCHNHGWGVPVDRVEGEKWMRAAAATGHWRATVCRTPSGRPASEKGVAICRLIPKTRVRVREGVLGMKLATLQRSCTPRRILEQMRHPKVRNAAPSFWRSRSLCCANGMRG